MNLAKLNEHPLNQAALRRLDRENADSDRNLMHLLTLAHVGLVVDEEPVDPFSPQGKVLMDWTQDAGFQTAALENLEDALDTDEVLELPLPEVAERIVDTLMAASRS
jgi:hypothetical protein